MFGKRIPLVIGLAGRAGSGKDTVGRILTKLEPEYTTMSFAFPIKMAVASLFGFHMNTLNDPVLKEVVDPDWGFSPRKAMQILGTEFGRNLNPDVWVKILAKRVEGVYSVITDVRFENEAAWVRENGVLIHIAVPDSVGTTSEKAHASEAGVKIDLNRDITLFNDHAGLDELEERVQGILVVLNNRFGYEFRGQ